VNKLNQAAQSRLILFGVVILGSIIRLIPAILGDFPINDGGMFLTMTQELLDNEFVLPMITGYNSLQIPFVYPPFAFYFIAVIHKLTGVPLELLFLWLPAIVNVITLVAFIYLAKAFFGDSPFKIALATAAYAFIPRSINWLSMGGGVTRGLGQLFFILIIASVYMLFTSIEVKSQLIILSVFFGTAIVLSHPATTIHTIIAIALLLIILPNKKKNFTTSIWIVLGVSLFTTPWLIIILERHGLSPILNAANTSDTGASFFTFIPRFLYANEPFLSIITIFSLIGMAAQLTRKKNFLPIWIILAFLIAPRGAPRATIVPMALLASIGLTDIILNGLANINRGSQLKTEPMLLSFTAVKLFLFACLCYATMNISFVVFRLTLQHVSTETRTAMEWVKNDTPENSQFVVLTGDTTAMCDSIQEWFPVLSDRTSVTTAQGKEWINGEQFTKEKENYPALQTCVLADDEACIKEYTIETVYDYLFLMKTIKSRNCIPITKSNSTGPSPYSTGALQQSLFHSKEWFPVYENDDVIIFSNTP